MSEIKDETLNNVSGGGILPEEQGDFGEPKFRTGERVINKKKPDLGVGIIVEVSYSRGWNYMIKFGHQLVYTMQEDVEYPIR